MGFHENSEIPEKSPFNRDTLWAAENVPAGIIQTWGDLNFRLNFLDL